LQLGFELLGHDCRGLLDSHHGLFVLHKHCVQLGLYAGDIQDVVAGQPPFDNLLARALKRA
jgi:hypothetical protein